MVRAASLTALLLLAGMARAADFQPLEITAEPWVQSVGSIQAAPGTTPSRLTGVITSGSFVAFVDASVDTVSDAVVLHLSGTATSFNSGGGDISMSLSEPNIAFLVPPSPQSVVQVFADWIITTSSGWKAQASADPCLVEIDALEGIVVSDSMIPRQYAPLEPGSETYIGMATLPEGEAMRLVRCNLTLGLTTTTTTPGPFNATATLRFRYAKPLPLGDSNADGVADLVDVVVLRRQLAGLEVP